MLYSNQFFNEIVINLNQTIDQINAKLLEKGFIGGYNLGKVHRNLEGHMLIAVTEKRTKAEIDAFAKELGDIYAK